MFIVCLLLVSSLIFAEIYNKKVQEQVKIVLQKTFYPDIHSMDVRLTFLHHFPHPCLKIKNLSFKAPQDSLTVEVLSISQAHLQLNLFQFFKGNFVLKKVNINDARLHFSTNTQGQNIKLFKQQEANKNPDLVLKMEDINIKNLHISSKNLYKKAGYSIRIKNTKLTGRVEKQHLFLNGDIEAHLDSLISGGRAVLKQKPLQVYSDLDYDFSYRKGYFNQSILSVGQSAFNLLGTFEPCAPNGLFLDLKLLGRNEFDGLLALLNKEFQNKIIQTNPSAKGHLELFLVGMNGPRQTARMDAVVDVSNATLTTTDFPLEMDSLNFFMSYTNGEQQNLETSALSIKNLSTYLNKYPIKVDFELNNFVVPTVETAFDIQMDLGDFQHFVSIPNIKKMGGMMNVKGFYKTPKATDKRLFSTTQLDGHITFAHDEFALVQPPILLSDLEGQIILEDSRTSFKGVKGKLSNIPFEVKGWANNLYRLFQDYPEKIKYDVAFKCDEIYLSSVIKKLAELPKSQNSKSNNPLDFPDFISGEFRLSAPILHYKTALAKKVLIRTALHNGQVSIPQLDMHVLNGQFSLDARLQKNPFDHYVALANINISKIEPRQLLTLFNDFEQDVLLAENVKGKLSAKVQLSAEIDQQLNFLPNEFTYHADFSLEDAELIDFKPLSQAVSSVKNKAANRLLIDKLNGKALYYNLHLVVPHLRFNSNITQLEFFGYRTPNQYMDLYFELSLFDFLKSHKRKMKEIKSKRKEKWRAGGIHVQLIGLPNQMQTKLRRKKVWTQAKSEVKGRYHRQKKVFFDW